MPRTVQWPTPGDRPPPRLYARNPLLLFVTLFLSQAFLHLPAAESKRSEGSSRIVQYSRPGQATPPTTEWTGLPGEQEFDVDLSDQKAAIAATADRPNPESAVRW